MSPVVKTLSASSLEALRALSIYRFLTVSQFLKLGIGKSEASIRNNILPRLNRHRPVLSKKRKLGSFLPDVHYMTEHGARYLADAYKLPIEEFPYPKGQVQFGEMFARHRFAQIDFHIEVRKWTDNQDNVDLLFADMDFDIIGSRRHRNFTKKTEIRLPHSAIHVVPDGLFGITVDDAPRIYLLEVHRTTETKQVAAQVRRYMEVLETGAVAEKYDIDVSPLIFSVHMKDNVLRGVKSSLLNTPDFQQFKPCFVFNEFEQIKSDISEGWTFADGAPANPFPT